MEKNDYKTFSLAIFIVVSFVILATVISLYIKYTSSNYCFCGLPLWLIILLISLLGLFIGGFVYFILNKKFLQEKNISEKAIKKLFYCLETEERKVIKTILKSSGEITQRNLCKLLSFDKVKISRILTKLENKDFVKREKYGMTNKIILDENLLKLFKEIDVSKFETNI